MYIHSSILAQLVPRPEPKAVPAGTTQLVNQHLSSQAFKRVLSTYGLQATKQSDSRILQVTSSPAEPRTLCWIITCSIAKLAPCCNEQRLGPS